MAGSTVFSALYNSGTSKQSVLSIGTTTAKVTGFSLNISPALGWFISNKTVLGASININPQSDKTTYENSGGTTFQRDRLTKFNAGLGGFIRHYLGENTSMLPFIHGGFNSGISTASSNGFFYGGSGPTAYKETYDGESSGGFFANALIQAGFTKMLGDYTGLDFYVGYNFSYSKNTFATIRLRDSGNDGTIDLRSENTTTTKFTNHGVILGIGFQVFIRGKK